VAAPLRVVEVLVPASRERWLAGKRCQPAMAWRSERRLRERGGVAAMSLAAWAAGHASVGVGVGPLAGVICSFGGMGYPRDCPVEAVVVVCGRKSRPTWLVPAMATLVGAVFLLGGIVVEYRLHFAHQSWVKTQTRFAGG
jgi:hypothetical protein